MTAALLPIFNSAITHTRDNRKLIPRNTQALEKGEAEKMLRMLERLEDLDDVQEVYSNADISEDILAEL